ncbi:MAG: sulfoxide reductase heme-binding subunit YedZ [Chloroflexi bacterium]|nr:sulfoxide reductase heme-binding subunit YedZ [Chloroflexota bacterium]
MDTLRQKLNKHWLWIVVNLAALTPLVLLLWNFWTDNMGADPVAYITKKTGQSAIILLGLSLACTPINSMFGFRRVLTVRKSLGLYAFLYAALHLLNFVGLDYGFNFNYIFADAVLTKRYMLVGLSAFLILLPLAITSTKGWMKRLGRDWKRLHKLAYAAGVLAVLHYLWLVKLDLTWPLIYATILGVLLFLRVSHVRKFISRFQRKPAASTKSATVRKVRPMITEG